MATEQNVMAVRANWQRNIVCVFRRGPRQTHYLGINGPHLAVCVTDNDHFEREFYITPTRKVAGVDLEYSAVDFATSYMKTEARKMMPIAPSALRVLLAILRGSQAPTDDEGNTDAQSPSAHVESIMAAAKDDGFRKPDGPVAKIHKFLDTKFDDIRKGTMSRKACFEALLAQGFAEGTVMTQTSVWARNNGISFAAVKKKAKSEPT